MDALPQRRRGAVQLAQFENERIEEVVDDALSAAALEEPTRGLANENVGALNRLACPLVIPSVTSNDKPLIRASRTFSRREKALDETMWSQSTLRRDPSPSGRETKWCQSTLRRDPSPSGRGTMWSQSTLRRNPSPSASETM